MSHPPSAEGIVLVDFDGTLFPWGSLSRPVDPFPGAASALQILRNLGYRIGIFTSRLSPSWHEAEGRDPEAGVAEQLGILRRTLTFHQIPFDFITAEKVPAVLYLDDKAMRINESRDLTAAVAAFMQWGDQAL